MFSILPAGSAITFDPAHDGVRPGGASLGDIDNLREDIDETVAQTHCGKHAMSRTVGALKLASNLLTGLGGLREIMTIFLRGAAPARRAARSPGQKLF